MNVWTHTHIYIQRERESDSWRMGSTMCVVCNVRERDVCPNKVRWGQRKEIAIKKNLTLWGYNYLSLLRLKPKIKNWICTCDLRTLSNSISAFLKMGHSGNIGEEVAGGLNEEE